MTKNSVIWCFVDKFKFDVILFKLGIVLILDFRIVLETKPRTEVLGEHMITIYSCTYFADTEYKIDNRLTNVEQGQIHGNPVPDGLTGAVMQKPLGIQKCDGRTDIPTYRPTNTARCRVACPRLKINREKNTNHNIHSISLSSCEVFVRFISPPLSRPTFLLFSLRGRF